MQYIYDLNKIENVKLLIYKIADIIVRDLYICYIYALMWPYKVIVVSY